MPAYGAQGGGLRAAAGGDDDDDDGTGSVASAYSTYSSASAMTRQKNNFSIGRESKFLKPVTIAPQAQPSTSTPATTPATPGNNNNANKNTRKKGKGKGKKNKGNKVWHLYYPQKGSAGWAFIELKKETADAVREKALKTLAKKTPGMWKELVDESFYDTYFTSTYSKDTPVIVTLNAFATQKNRLAYDNSIKALWKFQVELKEHVKELYEYEVPGKPYDSNMKLYANDTAYTERMAKMQMNQQDFYIHNLTKLVMYFIRSLMRYTADSLPLITKEKLKTLRESDKTTNRNDQLRTSSVIFNELCNMTDVLTPWMVAISKANELRNTKATGGHAQHKVYGGGNKYGGAEDDQ